MHILVDHHPRRAQPTYGKSKRAIIDMEVDPYCEEAAGPSGSSGVGPCRLQRGSACRNDDCSDAPALLQEDLRHMAVEQIWSVELGMHPACVFAP